MWLCGPRIHFFSLCGFASSFYCQNTALILIWVWDPYLSRSQVRNTFMANLAWNKNLLLIYFQTLDYFFPSISDSAQCSKNLRSYYCTLLNHEIKRRLYCLNLKTSSNEDVKLLNAQVLVEDSLLTTILFNHIVYFSQSSKSMSWCSQYLDN